MTFTIASHNTLKGTADLDQFASITVRQEMWRDAARRELKRRHPSTWLARFGCTVTWHADTWTPGEGESRKAHRGWAGITPARGPVLKYLEQDGLTLAVIDCHAINGARHNAWKFPGGQHKPGSAAWREVRWVKFWDALIALIADVRRERPDAYVLALGDLNADDPPRIPGMRRVGERIDWIYYDDRLELVGFDNLGRHGSDHPVLRATLAVRKEAPRMDRFITKAEWGANPSKEATEDSHPIGATDGITAHWEGTHVPVEPHSACAQRVRNIERAHEYGRGWGDIAYNLLVCQHGYVFEGRGAGVRSAANGYTAANESHYAVCYLGGPTGVGFTSEGREGFLFAFDHLARHGDAGPERNGHRDHKATQCPGPDIYRWVSNLPPGAGRTVPEEDIDMTPDELRAIVREEIDAALSAAQSNDRSVRQNVRIGANARDLAAANGKALAALSEGFDERIRDNVKSALAEGVVDVKVTVTDNTEEN